MSRFLEPSDFTGKYKISKNCYDEAVLQSYIDKYEDLFLIKLLGSSLYDEFIADLDVDNLPTTARFIAIYYSFHKDISNYNGLFYNNNCLLMSEGMITMLKGFIYYHYISAENIKHTITGLTKGINENSGGSTYEMIYRTAEIRYNEALQSYINIQYFICDDLTNYSNWNGIKIYSKFSGVL